ncbi:DUF3558 domain-containing protein [Actinophytocola sediminis]
MLALVIAASGCSERSGEARSSTPSPTKTTIPAPASLEIPPVAQPLDVSPFAADPCALLDDSQRRELGLPTPVPEYFPDYKICYLHVDTERTDPLNFLQLVVFGDEGLADQYAKCNTLDCSQWTTDSVDGYPVIRARDDLTSKSGSCKIFLGVADNASVAITNAAHDPDADGPGCERADRAATMTIAALS